MNLPLSVHEQILLLSLDDETGWWGEVPAQFLLASAALIELLRRKLIRVDLDNNIVVVNPAPAGDAFLDFLLGELTKRAPQWSPVLIESVFKGKKVGDRIAETLVEQGILERRDGRAMWVFPRTEYPTRDPGPEREVRDRLRDAIINDQSPSADTTVVVALLRAGAGLSCLLSGEEMRQHGERLRWFCHEALATVHPDPDICHDTGVIVRATALALVDDAQSFELWW